MLEGAGDRRQRFKRRQRAEDEKGNQRPGCVLPPTPPEASHSMAITATPPISSISACEKAVSSD
jgi:hypothetical protein